MGQSTGRRGPAVARPRWARTVRFSLALYALAGVLLLAPGPLVAYAAPLVLPYVWLAWPFRSLPDESAPSANRGWRRFIGVNYACGFLLTQLLIWA